MAANPSNPAPRLHGRIVFHRYTNYDAWGGRLYLYDFATKRLRCLSERWAIDHAINGNFSPDGKQIVFMGVPRGQHRGNARDVFLWKVDSRAKPLNLTERLGTRDEDPRFAPDGKRILFEQDGGIRIMDLTNRRIRSIPFGGAPAERSMPMFTADGEHVVYAEGARKDMDLFLVDAADGTRRPLAIVPEIQNTSPYRSTPHASSTSAGPVGPTITTRSGSVRSMAERGARSASISPVRTAPTLIVALFSWDRGTRNPHD